MGMGEAVIMRRSLPWLCLVLSSWPLWAHEGDPVDWERAVIMAREGRIVPLEQVVREALSRQPGTLLEVEFELYEGRWTYEVEILDADGQVWEQYFDARTGAPLVHRPAEHDEEDED